MIIGNCGATPDDGKGWFVGPWMSAVPVAVGWADRGVNLADYLHFVIQTPFVPGDKVDLDPSDKVDLDPSDKVDLDVA
jgi:hypothetical protein